MDHDKKAQSKTSYSIKIPKEIFLKIEKHICHLKFIENPSQSKQRWLINAFKEKLKKNHSAKTEEKYISVKIDSHLKSNVENQLDEIRKNNSGYNLKKWMIEAICEQLKQEEDRFE